MKEGSGSPLPSGHTLDGGEAAKVEEWWNKYTWP